jgi:hypothetical protein
MEGTYLARRSRPFQFGITTLAVVLFGRRCGANVGRRILETRSISAKPSIAMASKIGNIRTSGRALTNLQRMIRKVFTEARS